MRRNEHGIGIGNALILLIFMVVTLTVFSVLTLLTAKDEENRAINLAQSSFSYYEADFAATKKLSDISELSKNAFSEDDLISALEEMGVKAVPSVQGVEVSFVEKIDDRRNLSVSLIATSDGVKVTSWKTIGNQIDYDDSLNVWDGEGLPFATE